MTQVSRNGAASHGAPWCSLQGRGGLALAAAWLALVAIAVAGRIWQPEWQGVRLWNVTPLTAVALAAGALFANRAAAAAAPLAALAVSNLFEPAYGSWGVAVVVYAASAWPVLLGRIVNRHRWAAVIGGAAAGSVVFFLTTNLAHWAFTGDYDRSPAGLAACFAAALPFYRPLGDVVWTLVLFAGIVAMHAVEETLGRRLHPLPAPGRGDA
ncbi:MAG: DUF6580 family putative transport protein [Planctomycetia bacterium]